MLSKLGVYLALFYVRRSVSDHVRPVGSSSFSPMPDLAPQRQEEAGARPGDLAPRRQRVPGCAVQQPLRPVREPVPDDSGRRSGHSGESTAGATTEVAIQTQKLRMPWDESPGGGKAAWVETGVSGDQGRQAGKVR